MTDTTLGELLRPLPSRWLVSFIGTFEDGRVQTHPHARFVNSCGECCLVAAFVGARTAGDVLDSDAWSGFRGTGLEELSRRFEAGALTGQAVYEECMLALLERGVIVVEAEAFAL